jgi:hypothetical protein
MGNYCSKIDLLQLKAEEYLRVNLLIEEEYTVIVKQELVTLLPSFIYVQSVVSQL